MQSASTCDSAVKHCLAFVCVRESPSGLVVWVFVTGADCNARSCFGCGCKIILSIIIADKIILSIIIADKIILSIIIADNWCTQTHCALQHAPTFS